MEHNNIKKKEIDPTREEENKKKNDRSEIMKYIYMWFLALWVIIGMHVFYVYASSQTSWVKSKWWTFVEATTDPISFLPYTSENDSQKVFQHLLFESCVTPEIEWTNIIYKNTLCTVTTENYETFSVTVPPNNFRSDEEPITIEDVYFTYQTILKDNFWNQNALQVYKNISIQVKWSELLITFPSASIDNMIFFTNFILPQHILANQDFDRYTNVFGKNIISWTCWRIEWWENDSSSAIFDLTLCEDFFLKFYQVKYFSSADQLQTYLQESDQKIDLISEKINTPWYMDYSYIANKFLWIFYNTQKDRVSLRIRELLTRLIQTNIADSDHVIKDPFLFSIWEPFDEAERKVLKELLTTATSSSQNTETSTGSDNADGGSETENTITTQSVADTSQELPKRLSFSDQNSSQSYRITTIWNNWYSTKFSYDTSYTKISVTHNGWIEYFPQSYSESKKIHNYNFNPVFRNIQSGKNTYAIKWYNEDWDIEDTFQLNVLFWDAPISDTNEKNDLEDSEPKDDSIDFSTGNEILSWAARLLSWITYTWTEVWTEALTWENVTEPIIPLQFHYFENQANVWIISDLQELFKRYEIDMYFEFVWYTDSNTLEWKIVSQDFDLLLRTINMWLRKDISNILISDNLLVNPSWYTNENLASLTNRHFITSDDERKKIINSIDDIYSTSYPFLFLGKKREQYSLSSSIQDSPFPKRMYVYWRRKKYIESIKTFNHVSIDWNEVFSRENLWTFLQKNM